MDRLRKENQMNSRDMDYERVARNSIIGDSGPNRRIHFANHPILQVFGIACFESKSELMTPSSLNVRVTGSLAESVKI